MLCLIRCPRYCSFPRLALSHYFSACSHPSQYFLVGDLFRPWYFQNSAINPHLKGIKSGQQRFCNCPCLCSIENCRPDIKLCCLIWSSGLCLDTIVVFSCWWMWSVLSLFFSWYPFRISHPQLLSSQDTYNMMSLVQYVVNRMSSIYANIYFGWIWFLADNHCLGLLDINFHSKLFSDFIYFDC